MFGLITSVSQALETVSVDVLGLSEPVFAAFKLMVILAVGESGVVVVGGGRLTVPPPRCVRSLGGS